MLSRNMRSSSLRPSQAGREPVSSKQSMHVLWGGGWGGGYREGGILEVYDIGAQTLGGKSCSNTTTCIEHPSVSRIRKGSGRGSKRILSLYR